MNFVLRSRTSGSKNESNVILGKSYTKVTDPNDLQEICNELGVNNSAKIICAINGLALHKPIIIEKGTSNYVMTAHGDTFECLSH